MIDYFGVSISLHSVKPDGNCLYRALSHLILGNQEYYDILNNKLIAKFVNSHNHYFDVMRQSGIMSIQELQEHIKSVSERNACATNVELCMLGAIAGKDTVIIDCIDANSANWNVPQNNLHSQLEVPLQCDAIFEGQKLCVLHHRLNHHLENDTSTPSIFSSQTAVHNILHENLILHDLFYTLHLPPSKVYCGKGTVIEESKPV